MWIDLANRMWINLTSAMCYKRSQSQKSTYCFIPLFTIQNRSNYGKGGQENSHPWDTDIGD